MAAVLLVVHVIVIAIISVAATNTVLLHRSIPGRSQPVSTFRVNVIPNNSRSSFKQPFRISPLNDNSFIVDPSALHNLVAGRDRFVIKLSTDSNPAFESVASIDACSLIASGFKEKITLLGDSKGNIIFADYRVNATVAPGTQCSVSSTTPIQISTELDIFPFEEGPLPKNVELLYKAPESKQEDPSIFRKYWYIFLPVGLMLILTFVA